MSKSKKPRSGIALGMIVLGTGKGKVMRDKRNRRPKDARRQRELYQETT